MGLTLIQNVLFELPLCFSEFFFIEWPLVVNDQSIQSGSEIVFSSQLQEKYPIRTLFQVGKLSKKMAVAKTTVRKRVSVNREKASSKLAKRRAERKQISIAKGKERTG